MMGEKKKSFVEQDQEDWIKNKPKRDAESLEVARKMMREGLKGEKDLMSRVSPVAKKQATEHFKAGLGRYNDPEFRATREKQAYDEAGYKKGGGVKFTKRFKNGGKVSASKRGDGIAQRGKTRGVMR